MKRIAYTWWIFHHFVQRETILTSNVPSCTPSPFPFRIDSFSEGRQNSFERVASLESVFIPHKCIVM